MLTLKHLLAQCQICCHHWGGQHGASSNQSSQSTGCNLLCEAVAACVMSDGLDLELTPAAGLGSGLQRFAGSIAC
jgi:hypothetical protein